MIILRLPSTRFLCTGLILYLFVLRCISLQSCRQEIGSLKRFATNTPLKYQMAPEEKRVQIDNFKDVPYRNPGYSRAAMRQHRPGRRPIHHAEHRQAL
jgi:hypothetical protein